MDYITHRRFKGRAACGSTVNLKWGTALQASGDWILLPDGRLLCAATSENAHRHFSRNDDGAGARRGALTWAIAFKTRRPGQEARFTEEERALICDRWGQFLIPELEVILFNQDFFRADVDALEQMAADLRIRA